MDYDNLAGLNYRKRRSFAGRSFLLPALVELMKLIYINNKSIKNGHSYQEHIVPFKGNGI